jgi:His-Xaa-Ser system protein HxsD
MEDNRLQIVLDKSLYQKQAVFAAAYKFTDRCCVHIEPVSEMQVGIFFSSDSLTDKDLGALAQEFCNEVLDQQHFLDLNRQFGHLRNLIVEQAFAPVANLKERIDGQR